MYLLECLKNGIVGRLSSTCYFHCVFVELMTKMNLVLSFLSRIAGQYPWHGTPGFKGPFNEP